MLSDKRFELTNSVEERRGRHGLMESRHGRSFLTSLAVVRRDHASRGGARKDIQPAGELATHWLTRKNAEKWAKRNQDPRENVGTTLCDSGLISNPQPGNLFEMWKGMTDDV